MIKCKLKVGDIFIPSKGYWASWCVDEKWVVEKIDYNDIYAINLSGTKVYFLIASFNENSYKIVP
jgi:hypothetical protein